MTLSGGGAEKQPMSVAVTPTAIAVDRAPSSPAVAAEGAGSGGWRWWRRFARNRGAVFGLGVFAAVLLMAALADVIAPYDPVAQGAGPALQSPSWAHWAGTDSFGRDILSRIIYGARIALVVGLVAVLISSIVGVTLGLMAGYYGGAVDAVVMRVMDALYAFPVIFLAIATMTVVGFGVSNVIVAVAVGFIAPFARVTRGDVLAVKEEPFIEAARLAGIGNLAIIGRHVLPNVMAPIIVQGALYVSGAIIIEAGLSFLGLGPPPPTPVWGSMIAEGRNFIAMAPHVSTVPGIALTVTVIGLNLLGDGLRDSLDPRLRHR
jgi:peptide/nickel transport system permease protein